MFGFVRGVRGRAVAVVLFVAGVVVVVGSGAGMVPAQATAAPAIISPSTDITTGYLHTCALISDGTVTCWGWNSDGQLGTGDTTDSNVPVAVAGGALAGKTVTDITAGAYHTCALVSDGTVTCWGNNVDGQLGDGSNTDSNVPVAVTGGVLANKTVTHITAGDTHTCALISDGTVTCWGYNGYGQLGDGSNTASNVPVAVTGGVLANKTVIDITAGTYHTCALISDGTVACWGYNGYGGIGDGSTTNRNVPVAVALAGKTVIDITAGYGHTCALILNGTVTCWGYNGVGQLGDGSTTNRNVPVAVTGGVLANKTVTHIAAGTFHTCALISDGTVTCWGDNGDGRLGDGGTTARNVPVAVAGGALTNKTVTHITAGGNHTCALISDGTVTCWGYNSAGQLGDGSNTASNVPVAVAGGVLANKTVTHITAGGSHTCALISDGTVTCWGWNSAGQLGTGDNTNHNVPVAVAVVWLRKTTAPTMSGIAKVGATLTANKGTWAGSPAPTFTYQWYACTQKVSRATRTVPGTCATINGATQTTFKLTSAHKGQYITVKVTGTSVGIDPVSWLSASTSTKVLMQATATTKPTLTGTAKVGKTLTVRKGTWAGSPAPRFTYQWYACTRKVSSATRTVPGTCKPIKGATQTTFKLTSAHTGKYITVKVTGTSSGTPKTLWLAKTTTKVS